MNDRMTLKKCSGCKERKPIDEFYKDSNTQDGRNRYCKPCCKVNRALETLKKRPSARKHWSHSNRAKKYGVPWQDGITLVKVYKKDRGHCALCGQWVPAREASLDHKIPISHPNTPGHVWDNVQLTHLKCNMQKGDYYR